MVFRHGILAATVPCGKSLTADIRHLRLFVFLIIIWAVIPAARITR